jgi:hypothetical protein
VQASPSSHWLSSVHAGSGTVVVVVDVVVDVVVEGPFVVVDGIAYVVPVVDPPGHVPLHAGTPPGVLNL